MKYYKFHFYDETDKEEILSEQDIFNSYWDYWYKQIWEVDNPNTLEVRKLPLAVQAELCVSDYIVCNWGIEVESLENFE